MFEFVDKNSNNYKEVRNIIGDLIDLEMDFLNKIYIICYTVKNKYPNVCCDNGTEISVLFKKILKINEKFEKEFDLEGVSKKYSIGKIQGFAEEIITDDKNETIELLKEYIEMNNLTISQRFDFLFNEIEDLNFNLFADTINNINDESVAYVEKNIIDILKRSNIR